MEINDRNLHQDLDDHVRDLRERISERSEWAQVAWKTFQHDLRGKKSTGCPTALLHTII